MISIMNRINIRQQEYFPYILIAAAVVLFNLVAIWGCKVLLHDDPMWYSFVLENRFPYHFINVSPLYAYKEWLVWKIMAFSPPLVRGLYVMGLMVPISWGFYYLFRRQWGFSPTTASTAAILPNILPHQWQIPAGINMSYSLWGLFFSLLALITGFQYLKNTSKKNWLRLTGTVILYVIALLLMEQALFLFPPLALAFLGFTRINKKHIWLISYFFLAAAAKFTQLMLIPRKPVTDVPLKEIITRIGLLFKWGLPAPEIASWIPAVVFIGITVTGFILLMNQKDGEEQLITVPKRFSHLGKKGFILYLYLFLICWVVSSIAVFIFFSGVYRIRYIYLPAFGLNALLILSLYALLRRGWAKKFKIHATVLMALIIFSGVSRYDILDGYFSYLNRCKAIISKDLGKRNLPANAQVVITGVKDYPASWLPGGWERSSGLLKFILKRKDVTGLVGPVNASPYYNFDNHFNPKVKRYTERWFMTGLTPFQPVFLFSLQEKERKLHQYQYALQWKGHSKNASWSILKIDKNTGGIKILRTGAGLQQYEAVIKELKTQGISQDQILWGGPPRQEEYQRLQQLELDPFLFQKGFFFYVFQFRKISPGRAKKNLLTLKDQKPLAKEIPFGNTLQLKAVYLDEITQENGLYMKILHFLWQSKEKQTLKEQWLHIILWKGSKVTWKTAEKFSPPGLELNPGEFLWGGVRVPGENYKQSDAIQFNLTANPKVWPDKDKGYIKPINEKKSPR